MLPHATCHAYLPPRHATPCFARLPLTKYTASHTADVPSLPPLHGGSSDCLSVPPARRRHQLNLTSKNRQLTHGALTPKASARSRSQSLMRPSTLPVCDCKFPITASVTLPRVASLVSVFLHLLHNRNTGKKAIENRTENSMSILRFAKNRFTLNLCCLFGEKNKKKKRVKQKH